MSYPLPRLIGLVAGAPQSGKDTLYGQIRKHIHPTSHSAVLQHAFGYHLKRALSEQFNGFNRACLWQRIESNDKDTVDPNLSIVNVAGSDYFDWLTEQGHDVCCPRSARWHMKKFGTEYTREFLGKKDYWVERVESDLGDLRNCAHVNVVTDVRHHNEAEMLKRYGGVLVYIHAEWNTNDQGGISDGILTDADCDFAIYNPKNQPEKMLQQLIDQGVIGPRGLEDYT